MTHDEMIAVIAAHRDGKEIQERCFRTDEQQKREWHTFRGEFIFNLYLDGKAICEYRIKPEPREWWIKAGVIFRTREEAVSKGLADKPIIHVREVLEGE